MNAGTRALAGLWWKDGLRAWRVLLVRALVPLLLLGIIAVATVARSDDRSQSRETFTIAVAGEADVVLDRLDRLVASRLRFVETDDPAFATAFGADAGLRVPPGTARRIEAGEPAVIEVYIRGSDRSSRAAASVLGTALASLTLSEVRLSVPDVANGVVTYGIVDVQRTREGAQSMYAQVAAALLALHSAMLVGTAGSRLAGRRHSAQTAAVMLLPLSRRSLVDAATISETGLGLVSSVPLLVPTALGAIAFALLESGWSALPATVVAVVAASTVLCAAMVSLGTTIGLRVESSEQVSFLSSLAVVAMAVVAGVVALGENPPPAPIAVVPVAGVIDALRRTLTDGDPLSLVWLLIACASTAGATWLLLGVAARSSEHEPMGMRAS